MLLIPCEWGLKQFNNVILAGYFCFYIFICGHFIQHHTEAKKNNYNLKSSSDVGNGPISPSAEGVLHIWWSRLFKKQQLVSEVNARGENWCLNHSADEFNLIVFLL